MNNLEPKAGRILLVEDSVECQILVKGTLGKRFHVTCASRASEALKLLERESFDLIILVVILPDGDGFQLCAQFSNREQSHFVPIIFLTSKKDLKDKILGFSLGADDYVVKPFDPDELRARINAKLKRLEQRRIEERSIKRGDLLINLPYNR